MSEKQVFTVEQARAAGEKIGIDWSSSRFDVEQFRMGMDVELEHGAQDPETNVTDDDIVMTAKIARAHLNEFPDYYSRLAVMDAEAESRGPRDPVNSGQQTERAVDGAKTALILGALGVVFGDIGTSPIYTLQTVFSPTDPHPVSVSRDTVFGIVSMIVWSVTVVVTITYVLLVMRADNEGEGGIMALITLLRRRRMPGHPRTKLWLAGLGLFGASLFLGDSMITPAISVLSAVEGLKVASPSLEHLVLPITAVIILILFLLQRMGTASVGRLFGPVMLAWFATIAACGVHGITGHPEILKALSPTYALSFFFNHFSIAFFALAAVVLAVTGAEA